MICRCIRTSLLTVTCLFFCCHCSFAQKKKNKDFADGYIVRLGDTIPCKVYNKFSRDEIGFELTFQYEDGRQITYHPGTAVKGFGYMEEDDTIHYLQMDVPPYYVYGEKYDKAFVEVVARGKLTLYRFTKIKNSQWAVTVFGILGGGIGAGIALAVTESIDGNSYLMKVQGRDSLQVVGHKNTLGPNYFEREEIMRFVSDRPQVLARIPVGKFIYLKELRKALREYNKWHSESAITAASSQ